MEITEKNSMEELKRNVDCEYYKVRETVAWAINFAKTY